MSFDQTDTMIREEVRDIVTDDGDHDRYSHYVPKAQLDRYYLEGTPCQALCGKKWIPGKDPGKYPVCPECKEKWESLRPGEPLGDG